MFNLTAMLNIAGVNTASVQTAVGQVNAQLNKGTKAAGGFSDAIALRGINLGAYAIATTAIFKLSQAVSSATSDAIKFELELANIAQTTEKSVKEINKHAGSIRNISVAYGLAAPKIAHTIKVLSQAGYSFEQAKSAADSLAQTTLLSSFESLADTTDGLIAINKQFVSTMGDSARVLAVLNTLSKKYAVESSDLVEVTRKAGGVFSSTGGTLEEMASIFTTVRDTTRESAETVATALRTIFTRLQRPKTIDDLRQYGIELVDLKGQFIGNFKAIQAIQAGLERNGIKKGTIPFAEIVESIGGVRQQSTVIPLLTQGAKLTKVYEDATTSLADTQKDAAKVQETLSFQLSQTQQNFSKLISEISETETFKAAVTAVLSLANAFASFASSLKDVIPLLGVLGAFQLGRSFTSILAKPALLRAATVGQVGSIKLASGGKASGIDFSPKGTDTIPAMLTPGEFVIPVAKAQAFGYKKLEKIRRDGYLAGGGKVGDVNRNTGEVVTTLDKAKNILKDFFSSFTAEIQAAVSAVKVVDINGKSSIGGSGTIQRGSFRPQISQLGINVGNATSNIVAHEGAHAVDSALVGGGKLASQQPESFQNKLALAAKASIEAQIRSAGASEKIVQYRIREEELFADLLAKSSPAVRRIITSTTDAAEGSEKLAQYLAREGSTEGRLYGDIHLALKDRVKEIRKGIIAEEQAIMKAARQGGPRKIETIPEIPIVTLPQQPLAERIVPRYNPFPIPAIQPVSPIKSGQYNPFPGRETQPQGPPTPAYQPYGFGFAPSSSPVKPISIADRQEAIGAYKDQGLAVPANLSRLTPVASPANIGSAYGARQGAYAKRVENDFFGLGNAVGNTASRPSGLDDAGSTYLAQANAKAAKAASQLGYEFGVTAALAAGLAKAYTDENSQLAKLSPNLAGAATALLNTVVALGLFQSALASAGITTSLKGFGDFIKNIASLGGGSKLLSSLGGSAKSVLGSAASFLPRGAGAGGLRSGLNVAGTAAGGFFATNGKGALASQIGEKLSTVGGGKLAALNTPAVTGAASIGAGMAAAGAAAFAFGKILDGGRDLQGKANRAIAEGNIEEAGKAAVSKALQDDLTNLSTAVAVTASAIPVVGPILGAVAGFGIKLAGLIPGVETAVGKLRDLGAALGVLESTALIAARAESQAASNKLTSGLSKRQNGVSAELKGLGTTGDTNKFFEGNNFKNSTSDLRQLKQSKDREQGLLRGKVGEQANTSSLGVLVDSLGQVASFGYADSLAETAQGYSDQIEKSQEELQAGAREAFGQNAQAFTLSIENFVAKGGTDWNSYIASLPAAAQEMITLSGETQNLKIALESSTDAANAEAEQRKIAYEVQAKTTAALLQLENAALKATKIGDLGDAITNITSGSFRGNSLSQAANSSDVKSQAFAAARLGIKNYEGIVNAGTKSKDLFNEAIKNKNNGGTEGDFITSLKDIISAANPDIDQSVLEKANVGQLRNIVEELSKSGDLIKDTLVNTSKAVENGFNQYVDSLSRASEAQLSYNASVLEFGDAQRGRRKDLETFSATGTTIADVRNRRGTIAQLGSAGGLRQGALATSSRLTATGVALSGIAANNTAGSSAAARLQGDFAVLQTATKNQIGLIRQDIQVRQQLIDSLKEELALEASRAKSFSDVNRALSGQLGGDAKRSATRTKSAADRVEQAFLTGGTAGANRAIGSAVNRGENADTLLNFLPTAIAEAINKDAQITGAARAGQGGFGNEARNVARTGFTAQGAILANGIAKQGGEQAANEAALLQLQKDNVLLLSESARIFGDSIGVMAGQFTNFSTELKNIVSSLQGTSIALTLPTTQLVVTLNGAEALAGFQKEMKAFVLQAIADSVIAQKQGQL